MPKISVIVPIYNTAKYLRTCIDSVLSQSFGDFELILVNDGSPDESEEICKSYFDSRVKYYYKENGGLSSARNFGLDKALGEYIVFIDSDDYIDKDCLEYLVEKIEEKKADIVLCGFYLQSGESAIPVIAKSGLFAGEEINKAIVELKSKNLIDTSCNKIYRASFLRENNLIFPEGEIFEDTCFNLTALSFKPLIFVSDKCFYHYVQHKGSVTKSYNEKKLETMKLRANLLKSVTSGVDSYCDYYYIKCVFSAIIDGFLSLPKSEIKSVISKEISDNSFIEKANSAKFSGINAKAVCFVAKSGKVNLVFLFCKFTYILKYKFQKLFLRVK